MTGETEEATFAEYQQLVRLVCQEASSGGPNISSCSARRWPPGGITKTWWPNATNRSKKLPQQKPSCPRPPARHRQPQRNEPIFAVRTELHRLCAVDLTQVPGVAVNTALVLFSELGPDFVERFPTAKCFASWLGLCPDNRITGGKIISVKTREVKSRSAQALRLAAQSLWRSKDYLGECFRRWKARLGTPKAITAMAHKLARIIWHLIKYRQPYDPSVWAAAEAKQKKKRIARLQQTAATLGYQLIATPLSS